MNYAAVNAKINAMGAKPMPEQISQAAISICRYIPDMQQRDYIMAAARPSHTDSLHYYTAQWKRLARLDKPNPVALRPALGAEIDLNNILWMYRLKKYHGIVGDETYGYLIPLRYRLSREATRRMAEAATHEALLGELALSPYATDLGSLAGKPQAALTPEQALTKAVYHRYQTAARRYPNSLAAVMAYLHRQYKGAHP